MKSNIDERTGKPKIVLDLCGGTGSWSRPYRDAGYDVRLITLPDGDVRTYMPPENVYGILAAPPCTEFSLAKGGLPRDFDTGMETVAACLQIIWQCRKQDKLAFWALENPRGLLRQFLGRPHFTFEHELIPAQYEDTVREWQKGRKCKPKCLERAVKYKADFVYIDTETGAIVVEDTKGMRTKEYIIKRKLMLFRHGIRVKEV